MSFSNSASQNLTMDQFKFTLGETRGNLNADFQFPSTSSGASPAVDEECEELAVPNDDDIPNENENWDNFNLALPGVSPQQATKSEKLNAKDVCDNFNGNLDNSRSPSLPEINPSSPSFLAFIDAIGQDQDEKLLMPVPLASDSSALATTRRKSKITVRNSADSATPVFEEANLPEVATATRKKSVKRPAASAPSMTAADTEPKPSVVPRSRKPTKKKPELNAPDNTKLTLTNAQRAKIIRVKKKQEDLKKNNTIEVLTQENAAKDREIVELKQQLAIEQANGLSAAGLTRMETNMKLFFATIIPPLYGAFGPIDIRMAPSLASRQPSVSASTDMQVQHPPSQMLTIHMDFVTNVMRYEHNPYLNFDTTSTSST